MVGAQGTEEEPEKSPLNPAGLFNWAAPPLACFAHSSPLQTCLISVPQDLLHSWGPLLPSADHTVSLQSPEPSSSFSARGQRSAKIKEQAVLSDMLLIKLQDRFHYK